MRMVAHKPKAGRNRMLKRERLARGLTRREFDRERQQARAADPELTRPQFWWVQK